MKKTDPAPQPAPVAVRVDDKEYTLLLDFNRMCDLEEEKGISLRTIEDTLTSMRGIRDLFGAALVAHHGAIEPRAVGDLIFRVGVIEAGKAIAAALAWMKPDAPKKPGTDSEAA